MTRVLGLDLGTNSIGWAIVDKEDNGNTTLIDKGVHIFQDGVAHDKSGEKPAVQERTAARASRRHYFRRRLRKIELLKVLIESEMCPPLSEFELSEWKTRKKYPLNEDFIVWQRTDDNSDKNPYYDRYLCLTKQLDLNAREDRYILGRALYHLNQRRGFLSNRKDASNEDANGVIKKGISSLTKEMEAAGCKYLGEFFYRIYGKDKIRTRHTARNEHYRAEFNEICQRQKLSSDLVKKLERAIFYQRPLKSQKGLVGKCSFETEKSRVPISHPRFEEFRMWQFINSIKISWGDDAFRTLSEEEIQIIYPLFFRKSKASFDFSDIARKLGATSECQFNYKMTASVSGCPVIASILNACKINPAMDWDENVCMLYTKGAGKSKEEIVNDIWHALFSFDDDKKLSNWLIRSLQICQSESDSLIKSKFPSGYASLSLKATNKILPWLKRGFIYSDAVYLANLQSVFPKDYPDKDRKAVEENIMILLEDFRANPLNKDINKYQIIKDYLLGAVIGGNPDKLYHPSMIDAYKKAIPDSSGNIRLGSPRTGAFKNPMAMRALFRLRALINQLLSEHLIDKDTRINIEFSRYLNDSNKRKAIQDYQRDLEKQREKDRKEIIELVKKEYGIIIDPTDDDLLKYRLYEEQNHICPYTGKNINISSFTGSNTEFDIEHTIPRSLGGDDSQMNKTLCESHFNRFNKKTKLPSELANHSEILQRIESWKKEFEKYDELISFQYRKKSAAQDKTAKDAAIQRIHYLKLYRNYWKEKYERFTMTSISDDFSNRQGVDIGIIGKYAKLYLQTVFGRTFIVKGFTTADFRKAWGIQIDEKKERVNHIHHCIDAITIACIGKKEYDTWKDYMLREENHRWENGLKPHYKKPWPTFTEDVKHIGEDLIISHHTPDNMSKKSRKKLRIRGIIQRNEKGEILYCQGDSSRGLLHNATFYGAIKRDEEIRYVVRKSLDSLEEKDIKNIVDDVVREKVAIASKEHGSLKEAVAQGIWMNEEKRIPIKKVRMFTTFTKPVSLKRHRDASKQEHKRYMYVVNYSNYCMALYGDNIKKSSFDLFSLMDAAKNFKNIGYLNKWIPKRNTDGKNLRCILKIGTMVLFYENNPSELYQADTKDLSKRLYEVVGLSDMTVMKKYIYGTLTLKHHQEARRSTDLKGTSGNYKNDDAYRPIINILHSQTTFLVEGYDFELTTTGHIIFKQK